MVASIKLYEYGIIGEVLLLSSSRCRRNIEFHSFQKLETLTEAMSSISSTWGDTRDRLADLSEDQEDLKTHVLNRLDALDEKTAWCMSHGSQGAHPLNDRLQTIEQLLAVSCFPSLFQNKKAIRPKQKNCCVPVSSPEKKIG